MIFGTAKAARLHLKREIDPGVSYKTGGRLLRKLHKNLQAPANFRRGKRANPLFLWGNVSAASVWETWKGRVAL